MSSQRPTTNASNVDKVHSSSGGDYRKAGTENEVEKKYTPHASSTDDEKCKSALLAQSTSSQAAQKRKNVLDLFPWLNEVTKINQKCLGSITELKNSRILNAMDFLIGKLLDDYHEYYKSPKLAVILSKYIRQFLYVYRHLYQGFELGKEFFRRVSKVLAIYADLELCSSVLGLELDTETANRIQLVFTTHLEFAEEATILDVFINMKRLCRGHRGILSLLLKYFLVKITIKEPVEVEDDLFIKYLIVFKKWLAVEEVMDDKENIRSAFITQVKPKKTLCMNTSYAPYLPADEEGLATTGNYVRMLEKKYSLEPLIRALDMSEKSSMSYEQLPNGIVRKISEVVILSDDEEESPKVQHVTIKSEPQDPLNDSGNLLNISSSSNLIDLTDEAFEETDVPRHYISWLADLVTRAKLKPVTVDQRLELATVSNDVIVIDEEEQTNDNNRKSASERRTKANESHTSLPSNDSGCVVTHREEVGINCSSTFEMSSSSVEAETQLKQHDPKAATDCKSISYLNESGMECRSIHDTSLFDGMSSPLMNTSADSISSCSELGVEFDKVLKNQKISDRMAMKKAVAETLTKDSYSEPSKTNRELLEVNYTNVDSASSRKSPNIKRNSTEHRNRNDQPLSTTSIRKQQEVNYNYKVVDKAIGETDQNENVKLLNEKNVPDLQPGEKIARSQTKNRMGSAKPTSIKVVHPTRHNQSAPTEGGKEISVPKEFECSIPLSSIKTNSLFLKNNDHGDIRGSEQSENFEQNALNDLNELPDRVARAAKKVNVKTSPINQNNEIGENNTSLSRRRNAGKPDAHNDDESAPSTIQILERKTYIKPMTISQKSSKSYTQSSRQPHILSDRSPPPALSSTSTTSLLSPPQSQLPTDTNRSPSIYYANSTHTQTQPQPQQQQYKVFYSGTEIDLGSNDVVNPLSDCATSGTNPMRSLTPAFCESDNNLVNTPQKPFLLPSTSLPSAIVHPLGLENTSKSLSAKINVNAAAKLLEKSTDSTLSTTNAINSISNDERSSVEDQIDSSDNLTTISSNSGDTGEMEYKPEYMLQIYKELGDHLKTMGYRPEDDMKRTTKTKRLMNAASKLLEADDMNLVKYSPDLNEENDECDASLPFKKRRKLPVFSDSTQCVKEEDSDSQPPFEFPTNYQCEVEITSSIPSPPLLPANTSSASNNMAGTSNLNNVEENQSITHMECVSYPPTPMLSIANIVEYLPVRAYSTFKTPEIPPEMAPVRFNLVQQPAMVINNTQSPNVLGATNNATATPSNTARSTANKPQQQHVEFETTFNIIPPQQNISTNQSNAMNVTAPSAANNSNMNCGIVASDGEQYLAPTLSSESGGGFNVTPNTAIQYRQTFHSNQPYATTYSIQPTHANTSNLPANFDLQNMFNLRNYQMNPQNYHNLVQNSRINLQEKQAILLNDFVHSFTDNYEHTSQTQPQQQSQQSQTLQQPPQQMYQTTSQMSTNTSVDSKSTSTSMNKTMAPRTKAARKMVSETSMNASPASSLGDKSSAAKSNRVTRSSNRTTRAQQFSTEQKSPQLNHQKSTKSIAHHQTHHHPSHHKSAKGSVHGHTPRKTNRHK